MIGSLFSGIGGLELGLERAGIGPVAWQVEIDPFCRLVLEKHWPEAKRFEDVRTVGAAELAPVDVICGGFPCQDVSGAGRGEGLAGKRSGLWREYARIVGELRSRWVVVENVTSGAARWFDQIVRDLEQLGYDCLPVPLSASDVGAPHVRRRIFVVANRNSVELREQPGWSSWQIRQETPVAREPCESRTASDVDRLRELQPPRSDAEQRGRLGNRVTAPLSDAVLARREGASSSKEDPWWTGPAVGAWGTPESGVAYDLHGFSSWLVGCGRIEASRKFLVEYGNAAKVGSGQVLQVLRSAIDAQGVWKPPGGQIDISAENVLQCFLRELEACCDREWSSSEKSEVSGEPMRSLWIREAIARASRGRRSSKSGAGKSTDAMHALPQLLARDAESAWVAYRGQNASPAIGHWDFTGLSPVVHGLSGGLAGRQRRRRIRALGNSVVPQCAEVVGWIIRELAASGGSK